MRRLASQPWMTSARPVVDALETARVGSVRFVGGCVRNALMGVAVADVDIATQFEPDQVARIMRAAGLAVHETGIEHGTLTVVSDHQPYEVTTLRRDVETDGRRATVAFTQDWAEDAARRDFRMNALYLAPDGEIFDPTGGGLEDIGARRIVFVGDPETRLREDYLRILRFFRFFAWYGQGAPDAEGLAACAKLKGGLTSISVERIWMETKKLLAAPQPLAGLDAMAQSGVFALLAPEAKGFDLLRGVVALEAREGLAPDPMLRLLSLLWKDPNAARAIANRLKLSNEERERLLASVQNETAIEVGMPPAVMRRALYAIGPQVFSDCLLLQWSRDSAPGWSTLRANTAAWIRPVMPVGGADLLARNMSQGPAIGAALGAMEAAWIASDFTLNREALLKLVGQGS